MPPKGRGRIVSIAAVRTRGTLPGIGYKRKYLPSLIGAMLMAISVNAMAEPVGIKLPAQPLADSLVQFAKKAGISVAVDSALVAGKTAPALDGYWEPQEGLRRLLQGSGLHGVMEGDTAVIRKGAPEKKSIVTDAVSVRAKRFHEIGPLPGLGLTKDEIPGNVQSISAQEIKEAHSLSLTDLMNKKLQSVNVNDYQGNPFQMDVTYRGFTAGPQIGTPQGLSVFFDGIRVNEPFGDVVNWDMIPMNALASVDVFPGSNPIFGLNTLGGAFTVKTKDGFNYPGVQAEVLTGSYGRKQLQVEGGINNANQEEGSWDSGSFALYGAGNFFMEDGWRQNSPSKVNQAFGKASYRGEKLDVNLSTLLVKTELVGNGLLPSEMYAQDPTSIFTAPDTTDNTLAQFQLSGAFQVNDSFSVTGQVYRRNSKRHQMGADVFTDWDEELQAKRMPAPGEEYTCTFNGTNQYGLPDYFVVPVNVTAGEDLFASAFFNDVITNWGAPGSVNMATAYSGFMNQALSADLLASFRDSAEFNANFRAYQIYNRTRPLPPTNVGNFDPVFGDVSFRADFDTTLQTVDSAGGGVLFTDQSYFYTLQGTDVIRNYVMLLPATNEAKCLSLRPPGSPGYDLYDPNNGNPLLVDGVGLGQPGVVSYTDPVTGKTYYTPTAVFTDNQIDQMVDGFSLQFNWNFDKHKLMAGVSIDSNSADYTNEQRLGLLDANRNAYLAPDQIHPMFAGAFIPLSNNNFQGSQITKSVYFSETFSPVETLHLSASGRYNDTHGKNKIAARRGLANYGIGDFIAVPTEFAVCPNGDCSSVPKNFTLPKIFDTLNTAETEKFSYYSFNPSLGVSWQARPRLNVYANWAKGTRVPSVIELGCALDHGHTGKFYTDGQGGTYEVPKSLLENRQCTLPTTLSGDPYLPQIEATTHDIGLRGQWGENIQWNLGAYQTDLKDDIYFVAVGNGQGFFDSIGDTRRRGIEAGLNGKKNKLGFSLNYALTDATFQNEFFMISPDNSSAVYVPVLGRGVIQVERGDRMPGVPLHNLNASVSYDVTDKWTVGLGAVVHSESYVRGNENNEHRPGVTQYRLLHQPGGITALLARQPTNNPGKVPGYMVFNFQTSYKLAPEWTASLLVNNLLDKEYFSAGRLGQNPFSPSIFGGIGSDGYNHNSGDWMSTNFIAPGAPRGIWATLRYEFDTGR